MIQQAKTTHGDFRAWSTTVLHEQLENIINAKQAKRTPYYILVVIRKGYLGPPAFSRADNSVMPDRGTKVADFAGKVVFSCRMILMDKPPIVPMLSSGLWYVDNRKGLVKNIYVLPPDLPVDSTKDMPKESELVAKSGMNMPIVHNRRK